MPSQAIKMDKLIPYGYKWFNGIILSEMQTDTYNRMTEEIRRFQEDNLEGRWEEKIEDLKHVRARELHEMFDVCRESLQIPKTTYLVLRSLNTYHGDRYPVFEGDTRCISYKDPSKIRIVQQALNNEQINWGGATVLPDDYEVAYHGQDANKAHQAEYTITRENESGMVDIVDGSEAEDDSCSPGM